MYSLQRVFLGWRRGGLSRATIGVAVAFSLLQSVRNTRANDCGINDGGETVEVENGGITIRVYYDEGDCDDDGGDPTVDWPDDYAITLRDVTSDALDAYRGLGFWDPYQNGLPEYKVVADPTDLGNAHANNSCMTYGTDITNNDKDECVKDEDFMKMVAQHEMFHHMQFAMDDDISGLGAWGYEGTARFMQDKLFADLDASNYSFAGFMDEVNLALGVPSTRFFELDYKAALFWNYCAEQFGAAPGEPELGYDFVQAFWEDVDAGGDEGEHSGVEALENTIDLYDANSLNEVWLSYAIANYANDFSLALVPDGSKYDYLDENQNGEGNWNTVARTAVGMPSNSSNSLDDYAIRYYEANVSITHCSGAGFRGEADEDMGWAVLGINASNQVVALSRGTGKEFGRTIIASPSQPIVKIAAIVTGLSEDGDYDYWFDSGPLELDIFRPTMAHPARVNVNDDYRPFLVKVVVDGPDDLKPEGAGEISVLGLQPDDFNVRVDGIDSDVVTASYVGQYYWLIVAAPEALPIGVYDLEVDMCGEVLQDTELSSVIVDDLLTNHVLVVDVSGSMDSPTASPKLDSAKIAASLYTDAVSESDRVGLVSFSGNGVDCDDDATVWETLATATSGQKSDVQSDITNNLVAGGATAIGDGLWKGQDQLDLFVDPAEADVIVLLSDGLENEARRWNTFDGCDGAWSRLDDEDTLVHSIAFGPDSDQDMMQEISTFTGGDYEYVDVTATGMRGGTPMSTTNELAVAYMESLQQTQDLEQFFFDAGELANMATVEIPITEEGISEGLFYFNVGSLGSNLKVSLFDPDGDPLPAAAADVFKTDTHAVFHLNVKPDTGTWTAEISSDLATDFIAGFMGRNPELPKMELLLGDVPTGGYEKRVSCEFEQGVPVSIIAVLIGIKGPVLGADVEAVIERPDGGLGCSPYPLLDDGTQNDGQPNDGVYGWLYTETSLGSLGASGDDDDPNTPAPGRRGSYQVNVTATGISSAGEPFTRIENTSFQVCEFRSDLDSDGLPDSWEIYYGTQTFVPDALTDYDFDGMITLDEFKLGCDPYDPDTDGDGEMDFSEWIHGRCPTVPDELAIKAPIDSDVVTSTGDLGLPLPSKGLLLRFPWLNTYAAMRIERAVGLPFFFSLLAEVKPSEEDLIPVNFVDEGVVEGITYFYRFQAIGVDGGVSRYSSIVSATYFADCNQNGVSDGSETEDEVVNETFTVMPADWTFVGSATYNAAQDEARLTKSGATFSSGVVGSDHAWGSHAFEVEFDFEMSAVAGGVPDGSGDADPDGLTFIVTGEEITEPGTLGYGLGYEGFPVESFAVEFDCFQNFVSGQPDDPDSNHVGIDVGGSVDPSLATVFVTPDFDETGVWQARVRFSYGQITVWVTPPAAAEFEVLSAVIPEENIPASKYFAFGSGTGINSTNTDVDNVVITLLDNDCNGNGLLDDCEIAEGSGADDDGNGVLDACQPAEVCEGDSNGDGNIDPLDVGFVQARFGCPVGTGDSDCDAADANSDGSVDPLDVGFVQARFGEACP